MDKQDGALLVQLSQWGTAMGLEEALHAVLADDFDPEAASADDILVSRVLYYGETIGTLTRTGFSTPASYSIGCGWPGCGCGSVRQHASCATSTA
jgi:hypothetical protein